MKIFLGTPITGLLDQNNKFSERNRTYLEHIISSLRRNERNVFCAIEREKWGEELLSGDVCTWLDYKEMLDADIFISIPNKSHGVHVEIGWASALNKKIIILINKKFGIKSPLIEGLHKLTNTEIITFEDNNEFPSPETWENIIFPKIERRLQESLTVN